MTQKSVGPVKRSVRTCSDPLLCTQVGHGTEYQKYGLCRLIERFVGDQGFRVKKDLLYNMGTSQHS